MCHCDEMHGLLLMSKTNEIIYGGRARGISRGRVRAIRPQFNAASNGTTGWVHGTRVQFRSLGVTATREPMPGRPVKTVIDFPETGRHNRFQTLQVRNRSSAFLFSRRLATS